ncbi:GNAT family N-acetyltransferase [Tenacibaculum sp. HL-MS23]|uniref:GNAT family N-acetyltransferase n=1 Tax=Tenacibaculum TaxID=104267 RepID=UPI001C5006F6|nr:MULTISPECIES: GNAT family N-acetyltransferase [Tenacibaculum]QXP74566.1 GNAT family N-acetyltransferase [Tenacibaculum sp. AHE14PA]QXP76077.1 GNAT family N-acetyltransferase [Tenacibaculum sp. AHE15PA]WNW02648.1 GNAT family N-acetyltransferase [Tenacibaculum sp. HL-MS23]
MNYPTIFPELSTERLTLRQLSFNDKRTIFKLRSNKEINKLIVRDTPKNLNDADSFIQTCLDEFEKGNRIFWAIQHQESNQIIGTIVYHNINAENNYAEIGYELNPDFQNEGFMSEAMATVLEYGKSVLELNTIEAFTHQNNTASTTLLEKHQFILDDEDLFDDNTIFRLDINQE